MTPVIIGRCSSLPTELSSQLGAGHSVNYSSFYPQVEEVKNANKA